MVLEQKSTTCFSKINKTIMAGVIVVIGSFVSGNVVGYTSPAIPNINDNPNPFHLTWKQQSWFVSSLFLTGIPGSLLTGVIIDTFGRKMALMLCTLPMAIGWLVIISSSNLITLFLGRIIIGIFRQPLVGAVIVYNAEIASPDIRGALVSLHEIFMNAGITMCYIIGSFVNWSWLAVTCATIINIWLYMLIFIPESPRWLLTHQTKESTEVSLQWLRGNADVSTEIQTIQQRLSNTKITPWRDYIQRPLIQPLLICSITFIFQMFSGASVIQMYTVVIFQSTKTSLDPNYQTIIYGVFMITGAIIGTLLMDRCQRKTLMVVSGVLLTISMTAFGVFFKINDSDFYFASTSLTWLPITSLVIYVLGYAVGFGPIPYIIVNELFPTNARGRANSICLVVQSLSGFACNVLFMDIKSAIHEYGEFWVYSGLCLIGTVFSYFAIPNTTGKSLEETQVDASKLSTDITCTKL